MLDHQVRRMGYCQDVLVVAASDHPKVKRMGYCHLAVLLVEAYPKGLVVWEGLRGLALRGLSPRGLSLLEVSVLLRVQQLSRLPNLQFEYHLQVPSWQPPSSLELSLLAP